MFKKITTVKMVHIKCRGRFYPFCNISRIPVLDSQVPWKVLWSGYDPPVYNSDNLKNKRWADPDINDPQFKPKWNTLDGNISRKSYSGNYTISYGYPLNPEGRTGIKGRGVLGRWGPNHAADPIVSRWKINNGEKEFHLVTKLPILQICCIQRHDCDEWALPGGMVDPGEQVSVTLLREFMEEALNSLEKDPSEIAKDKEMISNFFSMGQDIYRGYVDDHRNTDNAWMETAAINFHDNLGTAVGKFNLQAGDDAKSVKWLDVNRTLLLYASHSSLVEQVVMLHQAHW